MQERAGVSTGTIKSTNTTQHIEEHNAILQDKINYLAMNSEQQYMAAITNHDTWHR